MFAVAEAYGFTFAYPSGDTTVGACLQEFGEFGRVGSTLAGQLARGATFVDVGANVGAYALPVSRQAARVIAIEAQPGVAALLARNIAENRLENVELIAAAAGPNTGAISFPAPQLDERINFGGLGVVSWTGPTVEVPMVRLDDVAPDGTRVVKIDVEGFELAVLEGAERLLAKMRPYWIAEAPSDTPPGRALVQRFHAAGYRTYWLYDPFVTPRAARGDWRRVFGKGDVSVLAAPREAGQPVSMVEAVGGDYPWLSSTEGCGYLQAFDFPPYHARR